MNDRHGYMAGRDEDRAADLHALLRDPDVRAIVCLQGGYGSPRLIPLLDEAAFADIPKILCGYSDITTLHLAQQRWANVVSFYSNGAVGVGAPDVTDWSKAQLKRALFSDEPFGPIGPNPDDPYVRTISGGRVSGRLAGGCAGLICGAIGTRLQPDYRGRIVVLEEIELEGYWFDGYLTHLRNAGVLDGVAGIVVGDIKTKWSESIAELSAEDMVEELLGPLGVPVISGSPSGRRTSSTMSSADSSAIPPRPLRLDVADDDPGGAVEQPDVAEMGQVAVEPVALELDLLEDDDPAPVVGLEAGPDALLISPAQPPASRPVARPPTTVADVRIVRVRPDRPERLVAEERPLQVRLRELRHLRRADPRDPVRVEADHVAPALLGEMERRDVAVAAEDLRVRRERRLVEERDQARRAVAALEADDRADLGVAEQGMEIGRPVLVAAGHVAVAVVDVVRQLDLEVPRLERRPRRGGARCGSPSCSPARRTPTVSPGADGAACAGRDRRRSRFIVTSYEEARRGVRLEEDRPVDPGTARSRRPTASRRRRELRQDPPEDRRELVGMGRAEGDEDARAARAGDRRRSRDPGSGCRGRSS